MKHKIIINKKRFTLDPSHLIQSGGEGMVFALGDTAVKLYHQPHPQQKTKLDALMALQWPHNILAPCQLVQNRRGQTIGFQMPKLPDGTQPFKRLSNPIYWQKNSLQIQQIIQLLIQTHQTIASLHHSQIVIGDLNEHNLFFAPNSPHAPPFFIDTDSYQHGRFPCPVANLNFLDPNLYHVANFGKRPYFTTDTDWYAYFVLLIKSLLHVHPYGGTHKQHKSLQARAQANISILHPSVNYPQRARHPESLSDELLHHLHRTFEQNQRVPFPVDLLKSYANSLTVCTQCQLAYPRQRADCPACHHQTAVPQPKLSHQTIRQLLTSDGFIEHLAIQPNGRILVIAQTNGQYKLFRLGIGGTKEEMVLFNGRPNYRTAIFHNYLVINPPNSQQLLILDISGNQPRKIAMSETATFRGTAVFATTPKHLYRIAGNWIMRGTVQNGHFVEDTVATAHKNQTQLFGSPYNDTIAGYHRIFAQTQYFVMDKHGATYDIDIPALPPKASMSETAVSFSPNNIAIAQKVGINGRFHIQFNISNHKGEIIYQGQETSEELTPISHHYPYTDKTYYPSPPFIHTPTPLTQDTQYIQHPSGQLQHHPNQTLWFQT